MDMATESIDDMYDGCRSEAASIIDQFGVHEWHYNRNFSLAWALGERGVKKPAHGLLKEDHTIVLYIYTKMKHIQQDFNKAVQRGKHKYSTSGFLYHYFYFYLTDAIQLLHHNQTVCRTTYHRTWKQFQHNVANKDMRFGAFTLAAMSKSSLGHEDINDYVSCFEIYMCFGADVTYYSAAKETAVQVLIPPYEVFKITEVLTSDLWCSVVYKLESTKRSTSHLNCKLNGNQMKTYVGIVSAHRYKVNAWIMFICVIMMVIVSLVLLRRRQECFVAAVMGALLVLIIIVMVLRVMSA
ncbi:ecto-ADP-ribosyltransferase 4-like isoform X2 [Echeneis naucrates]|nr:ecto-ADP-ribosyltransferase 4-like isoform X2 [Echeneis naucrates]